MFTHIVTNTQTLAHICGISGTYHHMYAHTNLYTRSPTDHLSREQLNTEIPIEFHAETALLMEKCLDKWILRGRAIH